MSKVVKTRAFLNLVCKSRMCGNGYLTGITYLLRGPKSVVIRQSPFGFPTVTRGSTQLAQSTFCQIPYVSIRSISSIAFSRQLKGMERSFVSTGTAFLCNSICSIPGTKPISFFVRFGNCCNISLYFCSIDLF